MSGNLKVSVVLPTLNRSASLIECLRALENQSYLPDLFEIIVVDDGSTDDTHGVMEEYIRQAKIKILYFRQERGGPGAARNFGVKQAAGEIIAFTEDDVIPAEHWLKNGMNYFLEAEIDCLEGRTVLQNSSEPLRVFDAGGFLGFIPCNLFVKKKIFESVGGYDPEYFDRTLGLYFREDADFGFKVLREGYIVKKAEDVVVQHPALYQSRRDYFVHARRYYFDPLLFKKNPVEFRNSIEKKELGGIALHRPFHYLSLFYILLFLFILMAGMSDHLKLSAALLVILLVLHAGIRFRYERSMFPRLWRIADTIAFAALPFYYCYWFVRGCRTFHCWKPLL